MAEESSKYSGEKIQRLQFLMRSGNSIVVDGVEHWAMRHREGRVVHLTMRQRNDAQFARLIVESIDLAQIEAVVLLPTAEAPRG